MLNTLKQWIVGEKGRLTGFVQGRFSLETAREFERIVRNAGFSGVLRVTRGQFGEFVLEGSKPKLEKFLLQLPQERGMGGMVLKIAWAEPQGKYPNFRLTVE
jgi:hypothetical protein